MKRTLTAALASTAVLTAAPAAMAQAKATDFGEQGQFIIDANRLLPFFGYSHYSYDLPTGPGENKNTDTFNQASLSFFYGGTPQSTDLGPAPLSVYGANLAYTVPRLGLDYVIVPNVTIGGEIVLYFTLGGGFSSEVDTNGGSMTNSHDAPGITLFGIAPRGGYILPLNDMFSLWLRGGFSYYTWTAKQTINAGGNNPITQTSSQSQPAIDLEPQFVFHIIPHVGFTAGITLDIPFAGGWSNSTQQNGNTTTNSFSSSILYLGLNLGMLAYF